MRPYFAAEDLPVRYIDIKCKKSKSSLSVNFSDERQGYFEGEERYTPDMSLLQWRRYSRND